MRRADLRLAGGRVLLPERGLCEADVLVTDGVVSGMCARSTLLGAEEVVSVCGLTVLPGVIDAHVHLGQDITIPRTPDDVALETASAAAGGVSTLIAYLMTAQPYDEVFDPVIELMQQHARIDFGLHFCIVTREQLKQLPHYIDDLGVSSFKFFMSFRGDEGKYLGLPGNDDGFLYDLLRSAAANGGMVNPHGENIELVWRIREQPIPEGLSDLATWNHLRPPLVEAEAQQRAAYLARHAGASVYAVHVTNADALDALRRQRERYESIYLETCPHYLTHDVSSAVGVRGKVNPPLRQPEDREVLWQALSDGVIDVVGSDHVPRVATAKEGGILKASAGFPGLETLLPVLLSEGNVRRGLPLERIAELTSSTPARLFGLYPRKGVIAVGSDADFAVVDIGGTHVIRAQELHAAAGYSIYDGWEMRARVVHTLVRGRFALRDGQALGDPFGRFQRRARSGAAAWA